MKLDIQKEALRARDLLRSFKSSVPFLKNNVFPKISASYNQFNIDADTLSDICAFITNQLLWCSRISKQKSVSIESTEVDIIAAPNRKIVNFINSDSSDANLVPLFMQNGNLLLDIRIPGGGFKKDYVEDVLQSSPFVGSYTDIGFYDGVPIGATATVCIELPTSIASQYSNEFLNSIAKKYCAAGITPVFYFY